MTKEAKEAQDKLIDSRIRDMLCHPTNENLEKIAEASNEVTRINIREGSFANKILPPEKIGNERLAQTTTEDLYVIDNLEPDSPGAKYVPFETVPESEIITGGKYLTPITRIETPQFTKDIDLLRTYNYPIRKMLTDNSIKDGMATHDRHFIQTVNSIVMNVNDEGLNPVTKKLQLWDFDGPVETMGGKDDLLSRKNFVDATKMLAAGNNNDKFIARNYVMLAHENTLREIMKYDRTTAGGDISQDMFKNGLQDTTIFGIKAISTIKRSLVPEGWVYFFAEPSFLGHNYVLQDWTMYLEKQAFFIKWFSYWLGGFSFGNIGGMALARFYGEKFPGKDDSSNG